MKPLSRFEPYIVAERYSLALLSLLATLGVATEALLPWPLKLIIDHVLTATPLPASAAWLYAMPGAGSSTGLLAWLACGVLLLYIVARIVALAKNVVEANVNGRLKWSLGAGVFAQMQALSLAFHRRARKGDLMHRVISDTNCLPTFVTGAALPAFTALISLAVFFGIMWQLDAVLALLSLLVVLPMVALMRVLAPRMAERAYEQQENEGKVWSVAEQSLSSLPVVQAFGREELEGRRFHRVAANTIRASLRNTFTQLQFKAGVDGCQALGVALIMFVGGLHAHEGALTVGSLVIVLSYLASLYTPLNTLVHLSSTVAAAAGNAKRVLQVFDADATLPQHVAPRRLATRDSADVALENVVFGYEPGRPVLHGIDLRIGAGETVALLGATGSGKSTLVSLIPRLFDPWQGVVRVNGSDVREVSLDDVRARVGFVLQDPFLLPLSIAENIAYGRPGASRDEIIAAAVAARADDFIVRLPQGYDSIVGERGATLSGGQRQRLAIARALLKDAPILILDEPTSALDVETESLLLDAVARLMKNRTTLIIAHRLSTIRMADRALILKDGHLAQTSTRDALLAQASLYSGRGAFSADRGDS